MASHNTTLDGFYAVDSESDDSFVSDDEYPSDDGSLSSYGSHEGSDDMTIFRARNMDDDDSLDELSSMFSNLSVSRAPYTGDYLRGGAEDTDSLNALTSQLDDLAVGMAVPGATRSERGRFLDTLTPKERAEVLKNRRRITTTPRPLVQLPTDDPLGTGAANFAYHLTPGLEPNPSTTPYDDLYKRATSFRDLLALNVKFLKGQGVRPPYNGGSDKVQFFQARIFGTGPKKYTALDNESNHLLPKIVKINEMGFLTTAFMDGLDGFNKRVVYPVDDRQGSVRFTQKSYIAGFLEKETAGRLVDFVHRIQHGYEIQKYFTTMVHDLDGNQLEGGYEQGKSIRQWWDRFDWKTTLSFQFGNIKTAEVDMFKEALEPRLFDILKKRYVFVQIAADRSGSKYTQTGPVHDLLLEFFTESKKITLTDVLPPIGTANLFDFGDTSNYMDKFDARKADLGGDLRGGDDGDDPDSDSESDSDSDVASGVTKKEIVTDSDSDSDAEWEPSPSTQSPSLDLFKCVRTFRDLVGLNIRYLQGEGIRVPYAECLHKKTVYRQVRLNKRGFLTLRGQPALKEAAKKVRDPTSGEDMFVQTWQKSFITGVVTREVGLELLQFLRKRAVYVSVYNIEPFREVEYTFPCRDYVLTRTKAAWKKEDLVNEPWNDYELHREEKKEDLHGVRDLQTYPRIATLLDEQCVLMTVAGKEFGKGSVEDTLLKFFMKPQYKRAPTHHTYPDLACRDAFSSSTPPLSVVERARRAAKADIEKRASQFGSSATPSTATAAAMGTSTSTRPADLETRAAPFGSSTTPSTATAAAMGNFIADMTSTSTSASASTSTQPADLETRAAPFGSSTTPSTATAAAMGNFIADMASTSASASTSTQPDLGAGGIKTVTWEDGLRRNVQSLPIPNRAKWFDEDLRSLPPAAPVSLMPKEEDEDRDGLMAQMDDDLFVRPATTSTERKKWLDTLSPKERAEVYRMSKMDDDLFVRPATTSTERKKWLDTLSPKERAEVNRMSKMDDDLFVRPAVPGKRWLDTLPPKERADAYRMSQMDDDLFVRPAVPGKRWLDTLPPKERADVYRMSQMDDDLFVRPAVPGTMPPPPAIVSPMSEEGDDEDDFTPGADSSCSIS